MSEIPEIPAATVRALQDAVDDAVACAAACASEPVHLGQCAVLCTDTHEVLELARRVITRPLTDERVHHVRRVVEAALVTAEECAAECERHADEEPACRTGAASSEAAVRVLRELLRELVDDDLGDRSSAT